MSRDLSNEKNDEASSGSSRRRYDTSGRQAEARARRRRVIEAASHLFLEQGYAATSIAAVATEAEVSPQMVYAAFDGKAGLLHAIVDLMAGGDDEDVLLRERPEVFALGDVADPAERLRLVARHGAELNGRVGRVLALVESVSGADDAVREYHEELLANISDDSGIVVRQAFTDLDPSIPIEQVVDVLYAMGGYRLWLSLVVDRGWSQEQYAEWLGDALVRILLPGRS